MKIVAESHIPFLRGLIEPRAQVTYADTITADCSCAHAHAAMRTCWMAAACG